MLAPQVLGALATIRAAIRSTETQDLQSLHQILLSLALSAICETIPGTLAPLVQSEKLSQGEPGRDQIAGTVPDRWISPRECACRLDISVRTLRRRARQQPYTKFCIPLDHGFKVSEQGLAEFMRRARR